MILFQAFIINWLCLLIASNKTNIQFRNNWYRPFYYFSILQLLFTFYRMNDNRFSIIVHIRNATNARKCTSFSDFGVILAWRIIRARKLSKENPLRLFFVFNAPFEWHKEAKLLQRQCSFTRSSGIVCCRSVVVVVPSILLFICEHRKTQSISSNKQ